MNGGRMGNTEYLEMIAFGVYLCLVIGIGIFFFIKNRKQTGDKAYFLGGRAMNGWVAALSAGASDMSAWVLMGLPASIYASGVGQAWIAIGLAIGYALTGLDFHRIVHRYNAFLDIRRTETEKNVHSG